MNEVMGINDAYFSWLALDSTLEEFQEEVESVIERENNDWIIDKIDAELRDHMTLMKELGTGDSEENKSDALNVTELINKKLGLLRYLIDSYLDNSNLARGLEEDPLDVKVVFAKNIFGNIIVDRHLEDIKRYGDSKYDDTIKLLERLYAGDTDFNSEKQKPLTSSNKLKGIYELKDFQVRLIYMRESIYTVVIGACVKKVDNDIRYRDGLENMKKQSEKYRQAIREGKLDMEEELAKAAEYKESLISGMRRGK